MVERGEVDLSSGEVGEGISGGGGVLQKQQGGVQIGARGLVAQTATIPGYPKDLRHSNAMSKRDSHDKKTITGREGLTKSQKN